MLACPAPALITVTAGATEPRYPSLKGIMAAKSKPVERLTLADLGVADVASTQSRGRRDRRAGEGGRRDRARATTPSAGSPISWPKRR